jgi:hypothetical protein
MVIRAQSVPGCAFCMMARSLASLRIGTPNRYEMTMRFARTIALRIAFSSSARP